MTARAVWPGLAPVVVAAAVLAAVPVALGGSRYLMTLAIDVLVMGAYAVALNVAFGGTGQLLLCLGALAGSSAYLSTILGNRYDVPLLVGVVAGTILAAALGATISWVAARRGLETLFLAIVTLGLSLVFANLLLGGRSLTGGETGLVVGSGADGLLGARVPDYYLLLGVLVAFLVLHHAITRSALGWAFRAVRADPVAAELAGVDVTRTKLIGAVTGSAMLGLTGALAAAHDGFISPTTFAFATVDVRVLLVLALGGVGTLLGPVVGAVAIGMLDELLRPLGQLRLTVYGAALMGLFLGFRRGLVPALVARRRSLRAPR